MDEELDVRVTVTRLRRRLSVESEGTNSPAKPSTPTKKRGTKLAKPALELIDENVTENVPKKTTRKSIARDAVEASEEKVLTPSRRSARIRSNTSLVAEASQNVVDSPRARRATRRNSQIGSDTETTTTPARPTRKTRKDSTSSVEKLAIPNINEKITTQVSEVITEEPEKEITKTSNVDGSNKQSPLRKSPRLNKKGNKSIDEEVKDVKEKNEPKDKTLNDTPKLADETSSSLNGQSSLTMFNTKDKSDDKLESKNSGKENLSITSANLINEIETKPKISSVFNKTISAIEEIGNEKNSRKRTKSWTTITSYPPIEEGNQDKLGAGDSRLKSNEEFGVESSNKSINKPLLILNSSMENKENVNFLKSVDMLNASDTLKLLEKAPSKDIQSVVLLDDSDSNSGSIGKLTIDLKHDDEVQHNDGEDQCVPVIKQSTPKKSVSESFTVEPMDIDETIPENVTINDFSDKTNSSKEEDKVPDSKLKSFIPNETSNKINESFNKSKRSHSISLQQESNRSKRKSSIGTSEDNNNESKTPLNIFNRSSLSDKSQRKSSISIQIENDENPNKNGNKSNKKSSLSKSTSFQVEDNKTSEESRRKSLPETESQKLDKNSNENKSTLVLSQLKDVSSNEISNVSKSPNDTNVEVSKSVNILAKEPNKKNLSLNYQTSTPLQQKPLQQIAMQINTSIISPNANSKNTSKVNNTKSPKEILTYVIHNSDSSSDDENSREKSKMIDDEAEVASDNYESGDSRDDEERQYENEHEIVEKGETLESEQEHSNDSTYEKDSFIVSSDAEDYDLLSGSGDDLSCSDNELKMTAKSKEKFNERKRKERMKASKEMYEARHNLNVSDNSSKSKTKKSKRQRLESDKEDEARQPRNKNRLRIDSSQDVNLNNSDADGSIRVEKKKVRRLSDSVCEDNANEIEITLCNQSTVEKDDPLSLAIKQESKTPQKNLNISTVLVNADIEEVQVDANASVMKSNETTDPLQATLAHEEECDSDISENMEIKENYDSVLDNLNKTNYKQTKVKTLDSSLNLNKKTKDKVKEPLVDQLNLTQTKKSKKNKAEVVEENEMYGETPKTQEVLIQNDDGETSDSIDMRLLFPEDSNDSEENASKCKLDAKQDVEPIDEFIPLRRTEAKTNIRELPDEADGTNFSFFIDTKGTYGDTSTQTSAKKRKKKNKQNLSVDNEQNVTVAEIPASEETSVIFSPTSEKKKKKKKKNKSFDVSQTGKETVEPVKEDSFKIEKNKPNIAVSIETPVNISLKSDKKKKKKNKSLEISQETGEDIIEPRSEVSIKSETNNKSNIAMSDETSVNILLNEKKKKNKFFDVLHTGEDVGLISEVSCSHERNNKSDIAESEKTAVNVSLKSDKKKKKNKAFDISQTGEGTVESLLEASCNYENNKWDISAFKETPVNVSLKSEKRKMKNTSLEIPQIVENTVPEETINDSLNGKKKKKKKKNKSHDASQIIDYTGEEPKETLLEVSSKSEKNNKSDIAVSEVTTLNVPMNSEKKKKKKNKSLDVSQTAENTASEETTENVLERSQKKKNKKNKSQDVSQIVDNTGEESDDAPLEVSFISAKHNIDDPAMEDNALPTSKNKFKKKKKKKNKNAAESTDTTPVNTEGEVKPKKRKRDISSAPSTDVADDEIKISRSQDKKRKISQNEDAPTEDGVKHKPKKRKATEDDGGQKKSKVLKENSFDKIHVPRLPESIVHQLDDQPPKKQKKIMAISTVPFQVDEAQKRKNKPSNYLEQSIYLNDSPVKQKPKSSIKNPKVLPFTPTAITSGKGYTSNFRINVLPQDIQFIAQATDITNFKNEYLSKQRKTKLGKFEHFKKQRNHKLSKF